MPKITEQSKKKSLHVVERPTRQEGKTLREIQKFSQKPVEPKVVVFRVFECVVHLEEALAQLKQVGIFPGDEKRADNLKQGLVSAMLVTTSLLKEYQTLWGEMPKT